MASVDTESGSSPSSATLSLEEASLPDLQQIWQWMLIQRFSLIALCIAVLVHGLIFSLGIEATPVAAPFTQALSVRFETLPAGKSNAKQRVQTMADSSYAVPANPPPRAPQPVVTPSNPLPKDATSDPKKQKVQRLYSPPSMLSWWQYQSENLGYYGPEELDQLAVPTNGAGFLLPVLELTPDQPGLLHAKIYINERGGVDRVEILDSDPPGVFDQAVLLEVYRTSFVPALKDGVAVKSQKDIEIRIDVLINQRLLNSPDAHSGTFDLD